MRRRSLRSCLISFGAVFAVLVPSAVAGLNRWTSSGPQGAAIVGLASDPTDSAVAYALTRGAGIYKTSNGGQSWQAANEGLPDLLVSALAVQPAAPKTLYAAIRAGIFISSDAGEHWRLRGKLSEVFLLALDPTSQTLYAGTPSGVFASVDGGNTWREPASLGTLSSLTVSPTGTAYAIALHLQNVPTLFRSRDQGQTWTMVESVPISISPDSIAIDRASATLYLVGGGMIAASTDDAKSWNFLPQIPLSAQFDSVHVAPAQIVPVGAGHVYAATRNGVFEYSERPGWTHVGQQFFDPVEISYQPVGALAISSTIPQRLYAAMGVDTATIVQGQADWSRSSVGLPGTFVNDVAVVTTDPAVAFATTDSGIFKTESGGESWTKIRDGRTAHIEVSPVDGRTAYASAPDQIVKTMDGGLTWTGVTPDFASVLAIVPSDPATLYAALFVAGMSKSSDGGTTWSTIMSGLPLDFVYGLYGWSATSIAVEPTNSSTVYVGQNKGVFKTTNGGANWSQVSAVSKPPALAIESGDPPTVYAAAIGVMRSSNGGQAWTGAGLVDKLVSSLTVSRTSPPALYAGTTDGHIYRSTNHGEYWSALEDGLTRASVVRLAVDSSGDYLYAATAAGVYQYHFVDDSISIERLPDDPLRLPRLFDQLLGKSNGKVASPNVSDSTAAFVLPVVGTATGIGGNLFATEVTLTNDRAATQNVVLAWLPQAYGAAVSSFRLTLPAASAAGAGAVKIADVAERLGNRGIGSLGVFSVDANDNFDTSASIGGSSLIWVHPADRRAPFSQTLPAVRTTLFADHGRAVAAGLQQDAAFRTNVGVVNLSSQSHQFTIQINGERASGQITLAVPPFSLVQVPLPGGDYGTLNLVVYADAPRRWLFYGSTINNMTEEAQTNVGVPAGN